MDCSSLPGTGGPGFTILGGAVLLIAVGLTIVLIARRRGAAAAALLVLAFVFVAAYPAAGRAHAVAPCDGGSDNTGGTAPSTPPTQSTEPQGDVLLCTTATVGNSLKADVLFTMSGDQIIATLYLGSTDGTCSGSSSGNLGTGFIAETPEAAAAECPTGQTAELVADQAAFDPPVPTDWWTCVVTV